MAPAIACSKRGSTHRELHTLVFNLEGYDVETACDGAAALERLAVEEFDVVVTDRAMPT